MCCVATILCRVEALPFNANYWTSWRIKKDMIPFFCSSKFRLQYCSKISILTKVFSLLSSTFFPMSPLGALPWFFLTIVTYPHGHLNPIFFATGAVLHLNLSSSMPCGLQTLINHPIPNTLCDDLDIFQGTLILQTLITLSLIAFYVTI